MKRFWIILSLPLLIACATANDSVATDRVAADRAAVERAAVERAVLDYAEALYDVDPSKVERSVHPELVKRGFFLQGTDIKYVEDVMTYQELYALAGDWNVDGRVDRNTARKEITILDIADQTASAKLVAHWGLDYIHLARYDGRWKIVSVLWQTHPPAGSS